MWRIKKRLQLSLPTSFVVTILFAIPVDWSTAEQNEEAVGKNIQDDKSLRDFGGNCMRSGCHAQLNNTPFVHGPVNIGACDVCHVAAGKEEDHKFQLLRPREKLCNFCHHPPPPQKSVHKAFSDSDCSACHNPHGGSTRTLLISESEKGPCVGCHEPDSGKPGVLIKEGISKSFKSMHQSLKSGKCLQCHRAHQSELDGLLTSPEGQNCFSCHDRELSLPSKRIIKNVSAEVIGSKFKHSPIDKGECMVCHTSHSSSNPRLLSHAYSLLPYESFSESVYELCLHCHDRRLVTEENTTITGFRDGSRNLHYVHVNRKKGRTCGICHNVHASDIPALMRQHIPFGQGGWRLPIGFQKKPGGGTCNSGCHKKLDYDNSQPPVSPILPSSKRDHDKER